MVPEFGYINPPWIDTIVSKCRQLFCLLFYVVCDKIVNASAAVAAASSPSDEKPDVVRLLLFAHRARNEMRHFRLFTPTEYVNKNISLQTNQLTRSPFDVCGGSERLVVTQDRCRTDEES